MKKVLLCLFLTLIINFSSFAQRNIRVMFYNVENLFDTKDNPKTNDDDFLPDGKQHWSNYRYWKKLKDLSAVIDSVGKGYPPALIGMCEIENDSVLFDLTKRSPLKKHKYNYIITHSKDDRGMNVALLYQRDEIKVLKIKEYIPTFEGKPDKCSRNILHVTGKVINGDTLDVFISHFPSRSEGVKRSTPYRIDVAKLLRKKVDALFYSRQNPNIIIMGDFNDYPDDISMRNILEGKSIEDKILSKNLYNMFLQRIDKKSEGSYKYRGKWGFLDQFVVSGNLLTVKNKTKIKGKEAFVFSAEFLLENDIKYGGKKPFRTYSGYKYLEGISDHLPIYFDLAIKE